MRRGNLFWVYQNGNFLLGKEHFTPGKKSGKMTLPPQKNFPVTPLAQWSSPCPSPLKASYRFVSQNLHFQTKNIIKGVISYDINILRDEYLYKLSWKLFFLPRLLHHVIKGVISYDINILRDEYLYKLSWKLFFLPRLLHHVYLLAHIRVVNIKHMMEI